MDADAVKCKRCHSNHLASPCCRVGLLRRSPRIRRRVDGADHFSGLPDDLRTKIASLLHCARAAANMSLLSRSWRGLWRHLPVLDFHNIAPGPLLAALDQVAHPAGPLNISLSRHHELSAAGASSLLHAAAWLEPAKIDVSLWMAIRHSSGAIELPSFEPTTSIALTFRPVLVTLRPVGDFKALQVLSLDNCHLDLGDMLPRCPRLRKLGVSAWPRDSVKVHSSSLEELDLCADSKLKAVDIAAPLLKKLRFYANQGTVNDSSLSFSAPLLEDLEWSSLCYSWFDVGVVWHMWNLTLKTPEAHGRSTRLTSNVEDSCLLLQILGLDYAAENVVRSFGHDIARIPVRRFSVLELDIAAGLHVYGPLVLDVLGHFTFIQKLRIMIGRCPEGDQRGTCPASCPCYQSSSWRSQSVSLTELKVVSVYGFSGEDHEADLLKVILRSATMLERLNLFLSTGLLPESCSAYHELMNISNAHPSMQLSFFIE